MIKAIIFDCFGVLVGKGFDETYRNVGGNPDEDRRFVSGLLAQANQGLISQRDFRQQITGQLGISDDDWNSAIQQSEQPDRKLLEYVGQLHARYKVAILSNANRGVVQSKLGEDCIERCFDAVIVSAEVGHVKPEADIYHYATQQLDVEPESCIFLDDLDGYVTAAQEVGMHGIVYKNLEQAKRDIETIIRKEK